MIESILDTKAERHGIPKGMRLASSLNVSARIAELGELRDGWLDGRGLAPTPQSLSWLADLFEEYYPPELPAPYLYPTPEGGIRAEWTLGTHEISLDIDFHSILGHWHELDTVADTESSRSFDLADADQWRWLTEEVGRIEKGAA